MKLKTLLARIFKSLKNSKVFSGQNKIKGRGRQGQDWIRSSWFQKKKKKKFFKTK